jgi:hypothetical protein
MESAKKIARNGLEALEGRRLLAFASSGVSTVTGDEYQSIEAIVPVTGGYVTAGTFSAASQFGNGFAPTPRGYSDAFLTLVKGSTVSSYAIGGGSSDDGEPKFRDDRAEFAVLPRRMSEDYPFGVSATPRRQDEYIRSMTVGPDGKLYVVLVFRNEVSLNTQNRRGFKLSANQEFDDFYDSAILTYSIGSKLSFERAIQIGGPFNDIVNDIAFDSDGNLIAVGSFERQCDFDPTSGKKLVDPSGRNDAFVAKYTPEGKLLYVSQFGSDTAKLYEPEAAYGVAVDANDNIYVGGAFAEKADFDPRAGKTRRTWVEAEGFTDGFTLKLNPNGTLNWVRAQGGEDFDGIRDVALAPNGGVYSVGYFEDEADLDPTSGIQIFNAAPQGNDNNPTATDLFSNRFDATGNLVWVKPLAGEGFEILASASSDASGNLILAGTFSGRTDFDPSRRQRILTTPESDADDNNQKDRDNAYSGFVAKYSPNAKLINVNQIDGRGEQDVFINAAAIDASGNIYTGGRYRLGLTVDSLTIGTATDVEDIREDAFALVFGSGFEPIV